MAFSLGSGQYVGTTSVDDTARVWPLKEGPPLAVLRGHNRLVNAIALSEEGSLAVTGSDDCTMCVWDWSAERAPIFVLGDHVNRVASVQLSRDRTKASRYLCFSLSQNVCFCSRKETKRRVATQCSEVEGLAGCFS